MVKQIIRDPLYSGFTATIGKYAIVGAASVVTHDVGDYEVVVGSPARVIKTLDEDKFQ